MELNGLLNAKETGATGEEHIQTNNDNVPDYSDVKYFSQLDKETASNKEIMDSVKDYKTIAELVKAHSEVKSKMKNALFMPSDNATEEETKAFFKALGVPENATEYQLDNCGYKDEDISSFKKVFSENILFRNAITKKQGEALWKSIITILANEDKKEQEEKQKLKDTYNARYEEMLKDQYSVEAERKEVINADGDYIAEFVKETGIGKELMSSGLLYNPKVMHALAKYHKQTRGEGVMGKGGAGKEDDNSMFKYGNDFTNMFAND